MGVVKGKKELIRVEEKNFKDIRGIEGKTLFERYESFEVFMSKKIDKKYKHFLAYPVKEESIITFYGKDFKQDPQLLSELTGKEYDHYNKIKEATISHYKNKVDEIKNLGKNDEARFLVGAIKYIDERFIFCYDDIVVLAVWGMKFKEHLQEEVWAICKDLRVKKPELTKPPENENIIFNPEPEYEPLEENVEEETTTPPIKEPNTVPKKLWYKRIWKWLLWLLLAVLIILLILFLFRQCNRNAVGGGALGNNDGNWLNNDPNRGNNGGIYDPYNPYTPVPTPPENREILPPVQGTLPPVDDGVEIIPGNPSIVANRLNILLENTDKTIVDLAKSFKEKYPQEQYKIIYYDDVVKRMQVEIPKEEREQLKKDIPEKFAPEFKLFVFDESLFEGAYTPNDAGFTDEDKKWYLKTIKAEKAWDITRGSEKITIAVVDNGFNLNHPELKSKVVQPYNVWTRSNIVTPQKKDHGTHVAGIALALADNRQGLCGVAPNCKFMPIQVANERGMMTTTSVLDGILYALYQGADVINVSLGSQFQGIGQIPDEVQKELVNRHFKEEERLWREVMRIAASHNSTLVVAAGNDNVLAGIDALHRPELFIKVSAVNKNNESLNKASFSNYGKLSTISAPGVKIYSSVGENGYKFMDGTSMAAPIVSGAIALMKSVNDTLTTKRIICLLKGTGLPTQGKIGNLIQLDKLLEKTKANEEIDCTPKPSSGDVQILLNWDNYNDLDLICSDPYGELIYFKNRRSASGGQLEIDMNVEFPDSSKPIENIYWKPGKAPEGTYKVYLYYYKQHLTGVDDTRYEILVKYGDKTKKYEGVINKEIKKIHICNFTLGNIQNSNEIDRKRKKLEERRKSLQEELQKVNDQLNQINKN